MAVCSRGQTLQEQEGVFPVMAEHSFLTLGFQSGRYQLSLSVSGSLKPRLL